MIYPKVNMFKVCESLSTMKTVNITTIPPNFHGPFVISSFSPPLPSLATSTLIP